MDNFWILFALWYGGLLVALACEFRDLGTRRGRADAAQGKDVRVRAS